MSLAIQKLPNGRHIVSLIGDPGPVPGDEDINLGQEGGGFEGSTALLLSLKDFWSREIALAGERRRAAPTLRDVEAMCLATLIAIDQWRALYGLPA